MPNTPTSDVMERLRPALQLLPVECRDTPDYAEATGPQFQAMTMTPDAFTALNALPDAIATIERLSAELERKTEALDAIVKSAIIGAASDAVETKQVALESIDDIASAALTEKEG